MDFILWLIFVGVLIHLWRRSDALQRQIAHLEQALGDLRHHLPRRTEGERAVSQEVQAGPSGESEASAADPVIEPSTKEVPSEVALAKVAPAATIPAERIDDEVPTLAAAMREPQPQQQSDPVIAVAATDKKAAVARSAQKSHTAKLTGFKFDFEDFFGRLLPIWAGGITLAVAGFFLVQFSIENGLLGPKVRVALSFLFGVGLLGAAEIAFRQEHRIADPRVRQALAGAGLATLYAAFYLAGSHYGLVGTTIAFLGLAGVTASAILLSFRFGLPSAILGLVGGFAAPMLVDSDSANLPMLALYLALVTGGLTYAGNKQGRSWLALGALAGGIGWGALMLFSGVTGVTDILAFGGYIVVLGALVPAFMRSNAESGLGAMLVVRLGAAGLAAFQMAAMVAQSGFSMLAWGLYGLLASTLAFFAWKESRMREASAFAALLALVMLALWSETSVLNFTTISLAFSAIFAGVPLANIWRDAHRKIDAFQIGGFALCMIAVVYGQFAWLGNLPMLALACLAIAILPALASWMLWPAREKAVPGIGLFTLSCAAAGVAIAGLIATPLWAAPLILSVVTLGVIAIVWPRVDQRMTALVWAASGLSLIALMVTPAFTDELLMLFGIDGDADIMRAILRWSAAVLPFIALSARKQVTELSHVGEVIVAAMVYGIAAQFIPANVLAWTAAGLATILAFADGERLAARLTLGLVALGWAVEPLVQWMVAASDALIAQPMLIGDVIGLKEIGLNMLPPIAIAATLILRPASSLKERGVAALAAVSGTMAVVTAHMLFKQMFALETLDQFAAMGLAERTVWQALMLASGFAAAKFIANRDWASRISIVLFAAALAHFTLFSFVLHNPLWDMQAVGDLPIVNLLLPAYGIAVAAVIALRRAVAHNESMKPWLFDAVLMLLIAVLAMSELRHVFAGSILSDDPVGQTEDLLRSLLGIILAIAFLMWGAREQTRSWRIGSLILMLAAVLKVFLLDASGLDGLVRVASFVALGFSLIGIGWFYSRQLVGPKGQVEEANARAD